MVVDSFGCFVVGGGVVVGRVVGEVAVAVVDMSGFECIQVLVSVVAHRQYQGLMKKRVFVRCIVHLLPLCWFGLGMGGVGIDSSSPPPPPQVAVWVEAMGYPNVIPWWLDCNNMSYYYQDPP